jgi:hypothetical protein
MGVVNNPITGPAPTVQPMVASSGQNSALTMGVINQENATRLNSLAGGYKGRNKRSKRTNRKGKRLSKGRKTRTRKNKRRSARHRRNKRSRLYKGGAGEPIPYSAPSGSNAAVLNISEELALAHATANVNSKFDNAR